MERLIIHVGKKRMCMKKFILIVLVIIFSALSVNAEQVFYFAGRPSYVRTVTGGTRSLNNYGSNAAFAPSTRHINSQRAIMDARRRQYARRMARNNFSRPYGYYDQLRPSVAAKPSQVSRLNKDFQINTTTQGHLINGVMCYY